MKAEAPENACVILLHGLARSHRSMGAMEKALRRAGYATANINYPSRQFPIGQLADIAMDEGIRAFHESGRATLHFVTHSLGGILLRQYTTRHPVAELHRVVMLGPPNQGSEAVDRLKHIPGYSLLNGPAGQELGTRDIDLPKRLGAVKFELGVIAGRRSINPVLSTLLPGENDGKVSVSSTQIEGMRDFINLPVTHTFMMRNPMVIQQTLHFLQHGRFDHKRV